MSANTGVMAANGMAAGELIAVIVILFLALVVMAMVFMWRTRTTSQSFDVATSQDWLKTDRPIYWKKGFA